MSFFKSLYIRLICFLAKIDLLMLRPLFKKEDERLKILLKRYGFSTVVSEHPSVVFAFYEGATKCGHHFLLDLKLRFLRYAVEKKLLNRERGTQMLLHLGVPEYYAQCPTILMHTYEEKRLVKYHVPENKEILKKQVVIYTVMTGDYDTVKSPLYTSANCDYLIFTNNDRIQEAKGWKIVHVHEPLTNLQLSRKIKMLPHLYLPEQYEISIYVDASVLLYGNIVEMVQYLNDGVAFAVTKHSARNRVIDELEVCHTAHKITEEAYVNAKQRYRDFVERGFKDDMGLAECGILVRKHGDVKLQEVMEMWWKEFMNGCGRDQIYLMPVIHVSRYHSYRLIDGFVFLNQYCCVDGHKY